jgi:hypothetical protein
MCESCFETFSHTKDVERPCRRAGCKGTWTDKRGAQLARAVRGKTGDPYPRYCTECEKELGDLQDREINCKTENCPGTWTWTKEQQLAAGVKPKKLLELEEAEAAAAEAAAAAAAPPPRARPPLPRGQEEEAQPQAPPRAPAARPPLLGLRRVPGLEEDAGDPLLAVRDPDLLAAREPAADPPRQLGHAHAVRCLQARRDRGRPQGEKEALRASHPQPGEAHAHEVAAAEAAAAAASEPPSSSETSSS